MMGSSAHPAVELPRFADRRAAQVAAFEALREALRPERWADAEELARAAFLASWEAGAAWRATDAER